MNQDWKTEKAKQIVALTATPKGIGEVELISHISRAFDEAVAGKEKELSDLRSKLVVYSEAVEVCIRNFEADAVGVYWIIKHLKTAQEVAKEEICQK